MIANLSIRRSDVDIIPVFSNDGGWNKANRIFSGQLPDLIRQWNKVIAV